MSGIHGSRSRTVGGVCGAVAAVCLLAGAADAAPKVDVVQLRNGNRLSCEIKKLQQGSLTIDTDALEKVSVHWDEVVGVESPREFEITLESGRRLYGALAQSTAGGDLVVPGLAGPTVVKLTEVTSLVPIGSSLWSRIDGNVDVGFDFAQANLETHWTFNGSASYRSRRYRMASSISSQLTARQDADRTSRNTVSLSASRRFDSRWFLTVLGQLQQNQELELELRTVGGGGLGRVLSQSNRRFIAAYSGVVYTRERFVEQPIANTAELALGGQVDFFTSGKEDFTLTNSITSFYGAGGRVRVEVQSAWRHEFLKDFYWSLNGVESFDSDPPDSQKKNDASVSLAIGWKF
jgi:uncharacterized protein DUF481